MALAMLGSIILGVLAGTSAESPAPPPRLVVSASARASVRIVAAARITLSEAPQPDGYAMKPAQVKLEDGTLRPAQLVEFQ